MKTNYYWLGSLLLIASFSQGQTVSENSNTAVNSTPVVVITGIRFSYPLVQTWIDDYSKVNPAVKIVVEPRSTTDPAKYDILIEGYEQDEAIKKTREYVYIARYAILPVANSKSAFARFYGDKGLNKELIKQLFFYDLYSDKVDASEIKLPYTTYTRLQKAGSPIVFAQYFGYQPKDIGGKAVAGSDEHLLKSVLRDSTSVSYLPINLVYDHTIGKPLPGLTILPVDLNGNGRTSDDEKIYGDFTHVVQTLETRSIEEIKNLPIAYLHLSVDKHSASPEAVQFLRWVISNGQSKLHEFGYLRPEPSRIGKEKFEEFALKRTL